MFQQECPVCEFAHQLYTEGKEEMAKSWFATTNYLMNAFIVDKDGVIVDDTCYVWSIRQGVFGDIWDEFEPDDAGDLTIDLTDVEEGFTLEVKRKGKGKTDTEYKVSCDEESSAFPGDVALLNDLHDLTSITQFLTPEQAFAVMSGQRVPSGNAALPEGNPWESNEALPEGTVDGEVKEVEPEPAPEKPPNEDETAAKAAEVAQAALEQNKPKAKKGKVKKEAAAEPAEEPTEPAEEEPSADLDMLKDFVAKRTAK
jgi:hypothetical protein